MSILLRKEFSARHLLRLKFHLSLFFLKKNFHFRFRLAQLKLFAPNQNGDSQTQYYRTESAIVTLEFHQNDLLILHLCFFVSHFPHSDENLTERTLVFTRCATKQMFS